jgi:hypothetical protein
MMTPPPARRSRSECCVHAVDLTEKVDPHDAVGPLTADVLDTAPDRDRRVVRQVSMRPKWLSAASARAYTDSGSATSVGTAIAFPPLLVISSTSEASAGRMRAAHTTFAPSRANSRGGSATDPTGRAGDQRDLVGTGLGIGELRSSDGLAAAVFRRGPDNHAGPPLLQLFLDLLHRASAVRAVERSRLTTKPRDRR